MQFPKSQQTKKAKKVKTKVVISLPQLKKKVQRVVNKYVRERDAEEPCISCGKYLDNKEAGHFIAQGSSGFLRYNFSNIHSQCVGCNRYRHGNLLEYRIGLIKRIGEERVKWLEENRRELKKWERQELEELLEDLGGK